MKVRLTEEIGTRAWLRTFVFQDVDSCPKHPASRHEGMHYLTESAVIRDWALGGAPTDHPGYSWPTHCDFCGFDMTRVDQQRVIFHRRLYNTESGSPGPGDLYWADWYHPLRQGCLYGWSNCVEPHLIVVLPNGRHWDTDGRCTNCAARTDTVHRCWVRHGEPPLVTVDKQGLTCSAGNGSVIAADWHGYLTKGVLRPIKP